jgi:lipoate-protein ligase A
LSLLSCSSSLSFPSFWSQWFHAMPILIDTPRGGEQNMALDTAMIDAARASGEVHVRLYSWKPWAVSLGYHQDASGIDEDACRNAGVDIVRRPTGGRAVFHADELTYAIATQLSGRAPMEWYAAIHEAIAQGLIALGVEALQEKGQTGMAAQYGRAGSAMCFASSARTELVIDGKKLVGSAQRVIDGVLLQHGSLLLGTAHLQMADLLRIDNDKRPTMRKLLDSRAVSLGEVLGRTIGFAEVSIPLAQALSTLCIAHEGNPSYQSNTVSSEL